METVRNGQKVWPYCGECGCRLDIVRIHGDLIFVSHFGPWDYTDARGCKCPSIGKYWISFESIIYIGNYQIGA